MVVILAVALDSAPSLRCAAYKTVERSKTAETSDVAVALRLPPLDPERVSRPASSRSKASPIRAVPSAP